MSVVFLMLSVLLSSARNLLSKEISNLTFGKKPFFLAQACIFLCGSLALVMVTGHTLERPAVLTLVYAVIYGVLLLSAQYCYTAALKTGNLGICSTVYSLGFIFPTLSGSLFWNESLTVFNILGILLVIPTVVLSGLPAFPKGEGKPANQYIFPLVAAMLSSGGLGVMQKLQQASPYPEQRNLFVMVAFALAGGISLVFSLFGKKEPKTAIGRKLLSAGGIGVAFGLSNLLNTILAGRLDSAVFFPALNLSTILFSMVFGVVFYREKLSKTDGIVLALGMVSILFITVL